VCIWFHFSVKTTIEQNVGEGDQTSGGRYPYLRYARKMTHLLNN